MTTLFDHTVLPPKDDASSLLGLVAVLKHIDHVALVGSDGNQIRLPFEVYEALREVVTAMANGQAITIAPHETILTTQGAADLLGISRPTLVRLLEAGEIPFTQGRSMPTPRLCRGSSSSAVTRPTTLAFSS